MERFETVHYTKQTRRSPWEKSKCNFSEFLFPEIMVQWHSPLVILLGWHMVTVLLPSESDPDGEVQVEGWDVGFAGGLEVVFFFVQEGKILGKSLVNSASRCTSGQKKIKIKLPFIKYATSIPQLRCLILIRYLLRVNYNSHFS